LREQVALFGRSGGVIEVQAEGESSFVLGSARQDSSAVMQSGPPPYTHVSAPEYTDMANRD